MSILKQSNALSSEQIFGFFLTEGFSLPAYSSIAETLRIANDIYDKSLFEWYSIGQTNDLIRSASGLVIKPDTDINTDLNFNKLAVISSLDGQSYHQQEVFNWLHKLDSQGCILGGITTGRWILANANLLSGHRCTIHWHEIDAFKECHPELEVSEGLFEIDHKRFSCAGGFAALDLIIEMIIGDYGIELANQINQRLINENQRSGDQLQNIEYQLKSAVVIRAIYIMKNHIESPVSLASIANKSAISQRQLVRLFQQNFQQSPQQFYLQLRLERAANLLKQTDRTITEIAVAVGFENLGHFSSAFKKRFACSPSKHRK